MNIARNAAMATLVLVPFLAGCQNQEQSGALIGGVGGAVAGGVIGHAIGGNAGTAIGALLGGATGLFVYWWPAPFTKARILW